MVVAIGMLLSLLTWTWQVTGAVIGGVGFGLFIDELGKFLTSDNNYFFKPTASLVYAIFIVLFLTARELRHFRKLTARENLVNAIEASKQLVLGPISNVLRNRALAWLDASDSSQPLTPFLHHQFELATATPERRFWFTAPVLPASRHQCLCPAGCRCFDLGCLLPCRRSRSSRRQRRRYERAECDASGGADPVDDPGRNLDLGRVHDHRGRTVAEVAPPCVPRI